MNQDHEIQRALDACFDAFRSLLPENEAIYNSHPFQEAIARSARAQAILKLRSGIFLNNTYGELERGKSHGPDPGPQMPDIKYRML